MTPNPTSTEQDETLEPNVHTLTVLVCQDCIDLKGEMCNNPQCVFCRRTMVEVRHYLDAMLLCPVVDGKRLILVGDAVTDEDTRRAPVAGPRGDVAFTAYNQAIEDALTAIRAESRGGGYWAATFINAIARKCSLHVYVNRLAAATSSPIPTSAESDDGWVTFGRVKVDIENETETFERINPTAPPESTRVAGEHAHCWHERADAASLCCHCEELPHGSFTTTATDTARLAAEEIRNYVDGLICAPPMREFERAEIERIISKHFPAPNDAKSLLSKITTIADIGSAEEFGDALERLQSIRELISGTTKGDLCSLAESPATKYGPSLVAFNLKTRVAYCPYCRTEFERQSDGGYFTFHDCKGRANEAG